MIAKFYLVEKDGVPAIWQSDPKGLDRMLKSKKGFTVASRHPSETRSEALTQLRESFPEHRQLKTADKPLSS